MEASALATGADWEDPGAATPQESVPDSHSSSKLIFRSELHEIGKPCSSRRLCTEESPICLNPSPLCLVAPVLRSHSAVLCLTQEVGVIE